ncbi:MAG: acyltransferase family protein [Nitrospirae bacterium]|nr:acyltransferase family protein [Nitrospirota bacterium]
MTAGNASFTKRLAKRLLKSHDLDRILQIRIHDQGWGYDKFGMDKYSVALTYAMTKFLYERWFRVMSFGHEHIPRNGRAILAANHSGVIPMDGGLVALDLLHRMDPPRLMRAVVDNFAARFPYINIWFSRVGQVIGTRKNFEELLNNEELVMVFPEGAKGPGKMIWDRYKLLKFNVGFMELSLRYKAPIIPIAIVGGEEQAPMIGNIKPLARLAGMPYFPVTPFFPHLGPLSLFPLPVRYRIYYGEPFDFHKEFGEDAVNDPKKVEKCVGIVKDKIHDMIQKGLRERKGIFF